MSRKSHHFERRYRRYGLVAIFLIILCSMVWCTPPLYGFSSFQMDDDNLSCLLSWDGSLALNLGYQAYFFTGTVIIPAVVTLICLIKYNKRVEIIELRLRHNRRSSSVVRLAMMVSRAHRTSLTLNASNRRSISSISSVVLRDTHIYLRESLSDDLRHEQCATQGISTLSIFSLLLWLPLHVTTLLATLGMGKRYRQLSMVNNLCAQFTCIVSPILVICFSKQCQNSLRSVVRACCCPSRSPTVTPMTPREQVPRPEKDNKVGLNKISEIVNEEPTASGEVPEMPPIEEKQKSHPVKPCPESSSEAPRRHTTAQKKISLGATEHYSQRMPKKGFNTKNNTHV